MAKVLLAFFARCPEVGLWLMEVVSYPRCSTEVFLILIYGKKTKQGMMKTQIAMIGELCGAIARLLSNAF